MRTFRFLLFWWLDFFFAIECLNSLIFGQLSGYDRWRWPDCPVSICGTHLQPCNSPHQHTKLHKRCANFSIFAILVVGLFFLQLSVWTPFLLFLILNFIFFILIIFYKLIEMKIFFLYHIKLENLNIFIFILLFIVVKFNFLFIILVK